MNTTDKLKVLYDDCLDSPGDPAMVAPMMKAAMVLTAVAALAGCGGGGGDTLASTGSVADAVAATNTAATVNAKMHADPTIADVGNVIVTNAASTKKHADPTISDVGGIVYQAPANAESVTPNSNHQAPH